MTPDNSYSEFLDDFMGPLPAGEAEGWQVYSDDEASWALRKIAQAHAVVEARLAFIQREEARLRAWLAQAEREAERTTAFFEGKLQGYLWRLREAGTLGQKKSWSLPQGTLQFRAVGEKWEVQDKDAVLAFAEAEGFTKVTIVPDMDPIRKLCVSGGHVPGMVLARQAGESFSVKLATDKKAGDV